MRIKNQCTLVFALPICFSIQGQKSIITENPCSNTMATEAKGRWIHAAHEKAPRSKEINTVLGEIHSLLTAMYPQPIGLDAAWHTVEGVSYFGSKKKNSPYPDGRPRYQSTDLPHFLMFYHRTGFFAYRCEYGKTNSLLRGYPGETTTWVQIAANRSDPAISGGAVDESWTINGLPVRLRLPVTKTTRGFEWQQIRSGANFYCIVIHRKGVLPYIPVTRKQYLEQCIHYYNRLYDESIQGAENLPVRSLEEQEKEKKAKLAQYEKEYANDAKRLKFAVDYYLSGYKTDQQRRDEQVQKVKNVKAQELKKFTDELERTNQQGLSESPAVISVMYLSDPIFATDSQKGEMLVVENPAYIRKDLPKHVPQFFVVMWEWSQGVPQAKLAEIIERDFPFEKLQAMIDGKL